MVNNLPENWTPATLGEICSKPQYGWTCKASKTGEIKILRTTDISKHTLDWDSVPYCEKEPSNIEKYRIHKNDILVSRAGSVGISYRVDQVPYDTVFASYLIRFKPLSNIHPKFVKFFLKSDGYWKAISDFSAGIAVPNVNASKLSKLPIPIAPYNEQLRIVAKLDKLLTKVDKCKERLEKIPAILKRFRQSVRAAACSGELTDSWRKDRGINHAWESIKLKDAVNKVQIGPFGSLLHKSDYVTNNIPVINPTHIQQGAIIPSANITISSSKKSELKRYVLEQGDIVVARRGEMGRCAVVREDQNGWICGTGSLYIRPCLTKALSDFLQILISSPIVVRYLERDSVGSTMTNLNQKIFSNLMINIPILEEQEIIIKQVCDLFSLADQIGARYLKAKTHVDKLTQSILAKAFRGELVPQEPQDEPASELLKRIKAEKEKQHAELKAKKKPKAGRKKQ